MARPGLLRPMLATPGPLPTGTRGEAWAYEMKWDGVRAVVYLDEGAVRVRTRNDREVSATYPELAGLVVAWRGEPTVLDGEIVAVGASGRPEFGVLQQRMHVQRPSPALVASVPVSFLVFDLLWLQGRSLLAAAYAERRGLLESLDLVGAHWDTPAVFLGSGAEALALSRSAGLEGVVAKRVDSVYEPGRRSRLWLKVKHERMQTVVVGGWKPGGGRRSGGIGSLLVGVPAARWLRYVGHVGTGFTDAMLAHLAEVVGPLRRATSPFAPEVPGQHARGAVWVDPDLVGEVAFSEWTRDGVMRHPSWRGLRPDTAPHEVTLEG